MSTRPDPLTKKPEPPDRVFYATGVLLDAEDFEAEQIYHRGRLARALAYAHGSGTVAGLGVAWKHAGTADKLDDMVIVEPGMVIDRLGRMIEVTRQACIRLQRWYDAQDTSKLAQSYRHSVRITPDTMTRDSAGEWTIEAGTAEESINGVVVDVFVRFVTCERGKTPAFASGPFDATDAVQPSRLRDGYELTLVPRIDDPAAALPELAWSELDRVTEPAKRERRLQDAILGRWRERSPYWTRDGLLGGPEHLEGQDPTAVFLTRMVLPASRTLADTDRPVRDAQRPVRVDNHLRSFVYTAGALARVLPWTGQAIGNAVTIGAPASATGVTTPGTPSSAPDAEPPHA
jgi:hypothetical protein